MASLSQIIKTKLPWLQAPMYHYSNAKMVAEVSKNGALGCLGSEYPEKLVESISYIQSQTLNPFAVNLFVFPPALFEDDRQVPQPIVDRLNAYRSELGIPADPIASDSNQRLDEQIEIVLKHRVPVVITTFGLLPRKVVDRLNNNGTVVIASVNTPQEAQLAEALGASCVIVQGFEAGGHRTALLPNHGDIGISSLVPLVQKVVSIPIIAAGGIVNSSQIAACLTNGAQGVSIGSLFLTSTECSTPKKHRDILMEPQSPRKSVVTRVFTGRPARMLENRFYIEMTELWKQHGGEDAIPWNFYARDIFGAAAKQGREDLFILWAGQSAGLLAGMGKRTCAEILSSLQNHE